ncbi:hypothetical protein PInf_003803 [Phytophthora infestans]|nr:hypothetical protein PInf_003803 [Phytophthora infestans]
MTGLIARVSPKHVPFTSPSKRGHGGVQKKRITGAQLFNLFRRIAGVAAALMYAGIGLQSAYKTIDVLQGTNIGTESFGIMEAKIIAGYCGDGLIRDSRLVKDVLKGNTSPRTDTLYLESPTSTSFEKCSNIEMFNSDIYNATFLYSGFLGLVASGSYNLTILQDIEFIMPVVDCTSPPLLTGDPSLLRIYNLVRRKSDPTDVHIVAISFSTQDYHVDEQSRRGSALLASLFSVSDMRATNVDNYFVLGLDYPYTNAPTFSVFTLDRVSPDGYWEMSSVPRNISVDPIIHVRTARRRGFYLHAESEQANMRNLFWKVEDQNPAVALSVWEWYGLIGRFTRERIDPAFALFLFEIIHSNRLDIIRDTSFVMKTVVDYANTEYRAGIATVTDAQKVLSPMRLWTTHMLNGIDFGFLAAALFPKALLVALILVYVGLRKVYHHFYPDQKPTGITGRSTGDQSSNEKAATAQKGNLTNFELSTGAELEARYGLISDYKNYVFFKGLKFASADGVYCSGYVVANGRFLVGSKDLLSIIMIKAFRSRFTNVYVYAVDGNTVQRTAQLVYPETLSWQDLIFLNINILA